MIVNDLAKRREVNYFFIIKIIYTPSIYFYIIYKKGSKQEQCRNNGTKPNVEARWGALILYRLGFLQIILLNVNGLFKSNKLHGQL
jgi:hypothetical protein